MIVTLEFEIFSFVLIWHTHLIAAAGTQLHHVSVSLLLYQVVSYHTVCTNKNNRCDYYASVGGAPRLASSPGSTLQSSRSLDRNRMERQLK